MGMISAQSITKECYIISIVTLIILILGLFTTQAKEKKGDTVKIEQQNVQSDEIKNNSKQVEKLTAWNIIKMCDWLLWPFILITAGGIMLITYRLLYEHREKSRSQDISRRKIKANDIRRFVYNLRNSSPSRLSRLMYQMISTYNKTNRTELIGADVNQFLNVERESFETFNRITGFISESAGALGLLGTVWGIFQTFHSGKLDGPMILRGMSIALVTTLVGLIISLLINMGSTYVFAIFNEQLKLVSNKAEELRQALMYLEKKSITEIETTRDVHNIRVVENNLDSCNQNHDRKPLDVFFK